MWRAVQILHTKNFRFLARARKIKSTASQKDLLYSEVYLANGMRVSRILSCAALVVRASSKSYTKSTPAFLHPSRNYSKSTSLNMSDEVKKAQEAAKLAADGHPPTIFDKLISGEWPSDKLYDDDLCMAFRDVSP